MDMPVLFKLSVGESRVYAITKDNRIFLYTLSEDPYRSWSIFMKNQPWWHRFMWFNQIRDYYISQGYSHCQLNIEVAK